MTAFDNSVAESVLATLQTQLLDRKSRANRDELANAVFAFIEDFPRPRRRHSTLGYLGLADYERAADTGGLTEMAERCTSPNPHRPGRRGHSTRHW